ncbi:MAG: hypothetical protein AB1704_01490 [Pseudomonadota bacterium]|uniref:hypothetical protein n=1 Tax=Burkholderiaceae TaxID=119060 RepID=UPI0010F91A27|nr:hypothetical protein [Burkholderia sp. 4M9327F10]
MNKATSTLIAAAAALMLSGGAYAQNNTLATPSVVSPAANATSGYGTSSSTNSDSGTGTMSPGSSQQKSINNSSAPASPAFGVNNTLATPSTASPAAQ